jgi:CRISPR system Cascade subunit CasA
MSYDLRTESWIPFQRLDGSIDWGPPSHLTDRLRENPVVGIAAPRPDFEGALLEFLIGLLTVALAPADEDDWLELWRNPPTPRDLDGAFASLPPAFDLDGDGPRFLQDLSEEDLRTGEPSSIEQLLIDAPGDQTIEHNKDLFVKRGRVRQLGYPAAAMALITMQTYAPGGGAGYRTSIRGGGPLTTLVDPRVSDGDGLPDPRQPLWRTLWANVETRELWARRAVGPLAVNPSDVFPWMAPTRTSEGNLSVTPQDAHPLQVYFGMPRRIRLEFGGEGVCDLTGHACARTVTGFRKRKLGPNYVGWRHPLSPHYAKGDTWLPVHGQPGGIAWRDWLGLTFMVPAGATKEPAAAVAHFLAERAPEIGTKVIHVRAFGYDCDNAKARGWVDATLPAFAVSDPEIRHLLHDSANRLTSATDLAASALLSAVKAALFPNPDDIAGDLSHLKMELWGATEGEFYDVMRALTGPDATAESADEHCRRFRSVIEHHGLRIFDDFADPGTAEPTAVRRYVRARYTLTRTLRGYSKAGAKFFAALRIPAHPTKTRPSSESMDPNGEQP